MISRFRVYICVVHKRRSMWLVQGSHYLNVIWYFGLWVKIMCMLRGHCVPLLEVMMSFGLWVKLVCKCKRTHVLNRTYVFIQVSWISWKFHHFGAPKTVRFAEHPWGASKIRTQSISTKNVRLQRPQKYVLRHSGQFSTLREPPKTVLIASVPWGTL